MWRDKATGAAVEAVSVTAAGFEPLLCFRLRTPVPSAIVAGDVEDGGWRQVVESSTEKVV